MDETENSATDVKRQMLRHTLATLAYRGGKVVTNAPASFATFRTNDKTRTPVEILAHICDLLDWAHNLATGKNTGQNSTPLPWEEEVSRFFAELERFDSYLASDAPLGAPAEKLFQGPIADALTHVGQIALLRRMAGAPVRGENYFKAGIVAGRVGAEQSAERVEFD
jgi:hypothetical protein